MRVIPFVAPVTIASLFPLCERHIRYYPFHDVFRDGSPPDDWASGTALIAPLEKASEVSNYWS